MAVVNYEIRANHIGDKGKTTSKISLTYLDALEFFEKEKRNIKTNWVELYIFKENNPEEKTLLDGWKYSDTIV